MKCRVQCLQMSYHRALWSIALNHAPLEAAFSPLVYPTMAIQSPLYKGPVMDGIANSLLTREPLCSDMDSPI